jgi:hypothetical protein
LIGYRYASPLGQTLEGCRGTNLKIDILRLPTRNSEEPDLNIEKIQILFGRLFTVAIDTHEVKAYGWRDEQFSFEIQPKGRDAGIFEIPCRWSM